MPAKDTEEAWAIFKANGYSDAQIRQIMVGRSRLPKRRTRKIDGQVFRQLNKPIADKRQAVALAEFQRDKGANARVIESKSGFSVFVAGSRRTYASTTSAESFEDRIAASEIQTPRNNLQEDKRSWWSKLTKRRVITGRMTRLEELEAQELDDFKKFKVELLTAGESQDDAYNLARSAATRKRAEAEMKTSNIGAAAKLKQAISQAQEREDIANYDAARESYNEAVPLSTIAKYNSLEIATTSTGALIGSGVAATTGAVAWPLVPIAALTGFFSAKAIRNNVGGIDMKRGVNRSLDALDVGTSGLVESVRVSKDRGQANWKTGFLLRQPSKEKPNKPKSLKLIEREERRSEIKAKRALAKAKRKSLRDQRQPRRQLGRERIAKKEVLDDDIGTIQ